MIARLAAEIDKDRPDLVLFKFNFRDRIAANFEAAEATTVAATDAGTHED